MTRVIGTVIDPWGADLMERLMRDNGRRTPARQVIWVMATAMALAGVTSAAAAPRHHAGRHGVVSATPPPVTALDCEEHEAWVDGDAVQVATVLPRGYTAVTDSNGAPIVFARAEHCSSLTANGRTRPVTNADWGVVVQSPDGTGCGSGTPTVGAQKGDLPPLCNWWTLGFVSDDKQLVDWLHMGTPTLPVSYVRHLTYRDGAPDATGRVPFHFSGGGFTIDDTSSFRPGAISLRGGYWFGSPQGTVKMIVATDDLTTGAADTTLHATTQKALARLMGATTRTSVQPYAQFGIISAKHGVLRKQLFGPRLRGEAPLHHFKGSCSVQGDVTFDPPATDTQANAKYTYDANGTCTGGVDGTAVNNAPVHLHQSGRADASCLQALAFPPGVVVLTFRNGPTLHYTLDFTSKATELDGTAYGTRSGQASGHGTFLTQRSSPTITVDCASGVKKAPMDMTFTTTGAAPITST